MICFDLKMVSINRYVSERSIQSLMINAVANIQVEFHIATHVLNAVLLKNFVNQEPVKPSIMSNLFKKIDSLYFVLLYFKLASVKLNCIYH